MRGQAPLRLFIYLLSQWGSLFLASPCAGTAVISSPHLISLPERDHTHRHHHCLISFQGLWRFFPATISCSISVWLFFCCSVPSSIMRVHYASVCLDNVPARSWSRKWKSYAIVSFCCSTAFLSFQFCWFCKNPPETEGQRERERRWGRKIFATSQSCLVVSSPGPM